MMLKKIAVFLLVALFVANAWRYRDAEFIVNLIHPRQEKATNVEADAATDRQSREAAAPAASGAGLLPDSAGVRKCRTGAAVSYSDGPCPAGSDEVPLKGAKNLDDGRVPPRPTGK